MLLLLVCSIVCGNSLSTTSDVVYAIENGKAAYPGQFPYVVSLQRRWSSKHFCGGTIINPYWILTAAHCFDDGISADQILVVAGTQTPSLGGEKRTISAVIRHFGYNPRSFVNDIAVVRLFLPYYWSALIRPVNWETVSFDQEVVAVGWGYGSGLSLKWLSLRTRRNCRNDWAFVCTQILHAGVCSGDSGGPLINSNSNLVGIVSNGDGIQCSNGKTQFFTRVAVYKSWINYVISRY